MYAGLGSGSAALPNSTHLQEMVYSIVRLYGRELAPQSSSLATQGGFRRPPQALLFDVYGTLLISSSGEIGTAAGSGVEAVFAETLSEVFGPRAAAAAGDACEAYFRHIGETHRRLRERGVAYPEVDIRAIWHAVLTDLGRSHPTELPPEPPAHTVIRAAIEYEVRTNPAWPMPGAIALLETARKRGMPLGIVSNAQFYTPMVLEALFGASLDALGFCDQLCVWSYRTGVAKPEQQLFEQVMARLQDAYELEAHDVLYIGNDVNNDVLPASRVGMQTALFAGDAQSLRLRADSLETAPARPDLVVADWNDLRIMLLGKDGK